MIFMETVRNVDKSETTKVVGILRPAAIGCELQIIAGPVAGTATVSPRCLHGAPQGMLVVAKILTPPDTVPILAEVLEVLGEPDNPDLGMQAIYKLYDVPTDFSDEVKAAAEKLPRELDTEIIAAELNNGRHDLRTLPTLTIDGVEAKDLDDALSIEILPSGGYRLYVHIADVSHYVKEDSPIDMEAARRGTSIYPVDRVVPMLPVRLSNGICSLNPQVDRLALTVRLDYTAAGERVGGDIFESVIKSDLRADYKTVYAVLTSGEPTPDYAKMFPYLQAMRVLAEKISARRIAAGRFDFDFPETKIELDADGKPVNIYPYETTFANNLIEEYMVAANEFVAERFAGLEAPFIYRIHENPDQEKLQALIPLCRRLGMTVRGDLATDRFQQAALLRQLAKLPAGQVLAQILLRAMAKACYDAECKGHYGLALKYYCHFTSPIRRYPDLFIHRVIKGYLHGRVLFKKWQSKAVVLAVSCSEAERRAVSVERDTCDLKIAEYMAERLGEIYPAIISGFGAAGIFVHLPNSIEGMVPFRTLSEYYRYNDGDFVISAERSGRVWQIGDAVEVQVAAVDRLRQRVDFHLLHEMDNRRRGKVLKTSGLISGKTQNKRGKARRIKASERRKGGGGIGDRQKSSRGRCRDCAANRHEHKKR